MDWAKLFQAVMQTEQSVLPIFIHNPESQRIVGVVLVAESIFGAVFNLGVQQQKVVAPLSARAAESIGA